MQANLLESGSLFRGRARLFYRTRQPEGLGAQLERTAVEPREFDHFIDQLR